MARVTLGTDSSGRPLVVDDTWLAKFKVAEQRLGIDLTIVQGSWRGSSGAAASAGTHDRGGVADIRTWNIPPGVGIDKTVRVLRECGLIAWHRTKAQGFDDHIHAIDYGNPDLAPSAARQVTAWENGRNGLANNGPDDGPRIDIPKHAPAQKDWFDMADKTDLAKVVADETPNIVKAILAAKIKNNDPDGSSRTVTLGGTITNLEADQDRMFKRLGDVEKKIDDLLAALVASGK